MDALNFLIDYSTDLISNGGILFGAFLVFIECFLPTLPLSVFVALNVNAFGLFLGVFISWFATCLGSFLCYLFFSFLSEKATEKFLNKKTIQRIQKGLDKFRGISFSQLVLLITLPFTPAFLINILGGLARVEKEKFLLSILIGKVFSIIFWGYIGKSFLTSLTDAYSILYISIALLIAYVLSKIISRKMNIE